MKWVVFCGMLSLVATTMSAQQRNGRCTGVKPDSVESATAQLFPNCRPYKGVQRMTRIYPRRCSPSSVNATFSSARTMPLYRCETT